MNTGSKTVVFYITDNGLDLAKRLKGLYPDTEILRFQAEAVSEIWNKCRNLIFIMATGIIVRTVAPLIKDKKTDPAVVVLDEKGKFAISLLSGHLGGANDIAREIANFLGGEGVITTASYANNMTPIDLWAKENNLAVEDWDLVPQIGTRLINSGALRVYIDQNAENRIQNRDLKLPEEFLKIAEPRFADVIITNKKDVYLGRAPWTHAAGEQRSASVKGQLYLRPKNLVIGIGCNSGTSEIELEDAVRKTLEEHNLSFPSIHSIATIDVKANESGLIAFAQKYNFEINVFTADELNTVQGIEKSEAALKATGANAVAEPAAIRASGADKLIVPKQKSRNVTVAVAELSKEQRAKSKEQRQGRIYIVGTGPGSIDHITPYAQKVIKESDVIVGYGTYLDLIQKLIKDKEVVSTGMTQEIERCKKAMELAIAGKTVSVISGGDPGIYAMAGPVFDVLRAQNTEDRIQTTNKKNLSSGCLLTSDVHVEVIPGISALNACAAKLGAPLMHDFAVISLSDRLTPWELIEKRLTAAAMSDFVTVLYNPKSMGRPEHINKAQEIFLRHRSTETPVGIVKGAMRENEKIIITNLRDMLNYDTDMQTTVIIGNSQTFTWNSWMITPRGYEKSSKFKVQSSKSKKEVAFLWDESFLWGLMTYKTLKANSLPFDLIRSEDIKKGCLKDYKMLFVPGGWASNKLKALGEKGIKAIKEFVSNGGNYLGFCGGAGLATLDGMGLLKIKRMPTKDRLPSFSGRIYLNVNEHPIWNGLNLQKSENSKLQNLNSEPISHAWWPSQFLIEDKNIRILATYGNALPDSFSSDLNVGDVENNGDWTELEKFYQINLSPRRLLNEPAIVEGNYGKGKVILSLIHFDTPDDENGVRVLKNLWEYFGCEKSRVRIQELEIKNSKLKTQNSKLVAELEAAATDLINFGMRNFLWFWRNPMLLQWRRGVRGLEYCTLYVMIKEVGEILKKQDTEDRIQKTALNKIRELLVPFVEKTKQLLILERYAMQNRHITYEKCGDPVIQEIRTELFGNSKSHGGLFKRLIDEVDNFLYVLVSKFRNDVLT